MPVIDAHLYDFRNSMEHWWPRLSDLDINTPATEIVPLTDIDTDGLPNWDTDQIIETIDSFPTDQAFLRADHRSATPTLDGFVYDTDPDHVDLAVLKVISSQVEGHVPHRSIAVREPLDVDEYDTRFYGDVIAPEVRVFIDNGDICCHHLDVQPDAFSDDVDADNCLAEMQAVIDEEWDEKIRPQVETVTTEFDTDGWSVDFIRTSSGEWVCIDMALYGLYYRVMDSGGRWQSISYHAPECPHNLEEHPPVDLPADPENPVDLGR